MENLISKDDYIEYVSGYEKEIEELQRKKHTVQDRCRSEREQDHKYDEWADAFRDYISVTELTRDMVLELIERIEVGSDSSITIYYKFQNPYAE